MAKEGKKKILGMPPPTAFAVMPLIIIAGVMTVMWIIKKF